MKHIAIIMDGNGRWAEAKKMPRLSGHQYATKAVIDMIDAAEELNYGVITLYAFSKDNFKREKSEVLGIFGIISDFLERQIIPLACTRNYKLMFVGDLTVLPADLLVSISKANQKTINNTGLKIVFAIAYSGREEILNSFNKIFEQKIAEGDYSKITSLEVERCMYTATLPDPDVLVRFGGYKRLSDFMLYQLSYSEMFFLDKLFPDATKEDIYQIDTKFKTIKRKFGNVIDN